MKKKPKLSFWQIWNLSFGFLGVQIGYSLQNSNTSSIFESLGADVSHLSYFWLAAPVAGMVIQPIVGMFSDGTWTRLGRRIPYILGGAIISTIALLLMPNCPVLLAFAPLAMGAFILLFMDLSFNVTMQPFRALVADMLDDSQKTAGYVVQTFLINLGAVIGAFLPLVMTWLGVSDEAVPGQVRVLVLCRRDHSSSDCARDCVQDQGVSPEGIRGVQRPGLLRRGRLCGRLCRRGLRTCGLQPCPGAQELHQSHQDHAFRHAAPGRDTVLLVGRPFHDVDISQAGHHRSGD